MDTIMVETHLPFRFPVHLSFAVLYLLQGAYIKPVKTFQ